MNAQAAKEQLIASALSAKEKDELNNLLRRLMIVAEQFDVPQVPTHDE